MSETRLVVRDSGRDWSGTIHGSCADRAVAALSAEPVTLAELEASVARFAKPVLNRQFFGNLSPGLCDEPYDAGLVVIDLVARPRLQVTWMKLKSPAIAAQQHGGERVPEPRTRHPSSHESTGQSEVGAPTARG